LFNLSGRLMAVITRLAGSVAFIVLGVKQWAYQRVDGLENVLNKEVKGPAEGNREVSAVGFFYRV
jgi:hypothetical protein